jgi:hypothetical protein
MEKEIPWTAILASIEPDVPDSAGTAQWSSTGTAASTSAKNRFRGGARPFWIHAGRATVR